MPRVTRIENDEIPKYETAMNIVDELLRREAYDISATYPTVIQEWNKIKDIVNRRILYHKNQNAIEKKYIDEEFKRLIEETKPSNNQL